MQRMTRVAVELWIGGSGVEGRIEVAGREDRSFASALELLSIIEELRDGGATTNWNPPPPGCAADRDRV